MFRSKAFMIAKCFCFSIVALADIKIFSLLFISSRQQGKPEHISAMLVVLLTELTSLKSWTFTVGLLAHCQ